MRTTIGFLVTALLLGPSVLAAQAQSVRTARAGYGQQSESVADFVSYEQFASMEQRLHELEARLASAESSQDVAANASCSDCSGGCDSAGSCCDSLNGWLNPCAGLLAQGELVFLRLHDSEVRDGGDRYDTGSRYTVGYMNERGRSVRFRYFEYFTAIEDGEDTQQLEFADVEYGHRFGLFGGLRGEFSAGLRWAEFEESDDLNYTETIGPVLGLEMRGLRIRSLDSYALARYSMQFGTPVDEDFGTFNITEVQLGLEYSRPVGAADFFAKGFFETQYWSGASQDDTQDIGLVGCGFALGLNL